MAVRVAVAAMSFLLALGVPSLGQAQLLGGASRVVRGHGGASAAPRVSARSPGARARGGATRVVVVGAPMRSSAPPAGASRAAQRRPPPAAGSPDRQTRGGHRPDRRGWGVGLGAGVAVAPGSARAVEVQRAPEPPRPRDDFAGGGGVTATGPIGLAALPPREPPMTTSALRSTSIVPEDPPDRVRARAGMDAQLVVPGAARLSAWGVVELPARIDLVLGYDGYGEPTPGGADAIAIGRLGIAWRFASEPWMHGRIGVNARHFQDWLGARLGVEAQLGLETRLADEVVVAISGAAGTLGSAWALQVRATIEADLDGIRLFAGYDHVALQPFDASQQGVELGGPIVGVSVPI